MWNHPFGWPVSILDGVTNGLIHADAVLFDSDGVLVDSHAEVEQAWRQLADEFGLDAERLMPELVGVRAVDTLSRYLPPDTCQEAMARLEDLEVALAVNTRPVLGAAEFIERLDGRPWTIVTSATRRLAEARWGGAGIPIPDKPVTAHDVSKGKPDPEPFLAGAELLGVDPSRCVVFEDSPSGGIAGRSAGASVIAVGDVAWSWEPAARIPDLSALTVSEGNPFALEHPSF